MAVRQAEPQLDHPPHPPVERAQHLVQLVLHVRLERSRRRRLRLDVLDQVPELGVTLLADRRLQRNRVAGGLAQGLDLQRRQPKLLPDLLVGRLAPKRVTEVVGDADELVRLIADVDRKPDRARLVADRAEHGLADPPCGVGRELEPAAVVELGHGAHQAHVALLDQVQQRHPAALVLLGDRDHQAQVGLGHPLPGGLRAGFDLLGQLDLLLFGQQGAPPDLAKVGAKGVVGVGLGGLGRGVRALLLEVGQDVRDLRRAVVGFVKPR